MRHIDFTLSSRVGGCEQNEKKKGNIRLPCHMFFYSYIIEDMNNKVRKNVRPEKRNNKW
jgi:hypothetical protein